MHIEMDPANGLEASDADAKHRPGVPQKRAPMPAGHAHWSQPDKQPVEPGVLKERARTEWTATFGTGQKPKGLSGAMRRVAYGIPDYEIKRWALLLLADRVDAMEWQLARSVRSPLTWTLVLGATAAVAVGAWQLRSRRRSSKRLRGTR